jgi:putative transposase
MVFIAEQAAQGRRVESICRVLREQGCQVAARTYREWKSPSRPVAARTVTDAQVINAVLDACRDEQGRPTPESLYGRRKMTAHLRRTGLPAVARCTVDGAMRTLGRTGVRRGKAPRTTVPGRDGSRAGDLLNRNFTALEPDRIWVTDFTYVRTWAGFAYVAFIVDVFAQRIVAWHAATFKATELVMTPLWMALWQRDRDGRPVTAGRLIHHSDAGSQPGLNRSSQHQPVLPRVGVRRVPRPARSATPTTTR